VTHSLASRGARSKRRSGRHGSRSAKKPKLSRAPCGVFSLEMVCRLIQSRFHLLQRARVVGRLNQRQIEGVQLPPHLGLGEEVNVVERPLPRGQLIRGIVGDERIETGDGVGELLLAGGHGGRAENPCFRFPAA